MKEEREIEFFYRAISLLVARGKFKKATSYLLNYNFIRKKTILIGISELIEDYKLILNKNISDKSKKAALEVLLSSLEQASHILKDNPKQINSQLIGYLEKDTNLFLDNIISSIKEKTKGVWLRPLTPSLSSQRGRVLKTFIGHKEEINTILVTDDKQRIISGSNKGTIKIWDIKTTKCIATIYSKEDIGSIVSIKEINKNYFISKSWKGNELTLCVWNYEKSQIHNSVSWKTNTSRHSVKKIILSKNKNYIFVENGFEAPAILVYDTLSLKLFQKIKINSKEEFNDFEIYNKINSTIKYSERLIIVSSIWNRNKKTYLNIYKFLLGRFRRVKKIKINNFFGGSITINKTTNKALIWNIHGHIIIISLVNQEILFKLEKKFKGNLNNAIMTNNSSKVILFSKNVIGIWDSVNKKLIKNIKGYELGNYFYSKEYNMAMSWELNENFRVWDLEKGEIINNLDGWLIYDIAFLNKNMIVTIEYGSKSIHLLDIRKKNNNKQINHKRKVVAIKSYDNGNKIITASADKNLKVIDLNNIKQLKILNHEKEVADIDVFKRGDTYYLLSVSGEGTNNKEFERYIKVWNLSTFECIDILHGHKFEINKIKAINNGYNAISLAWDYSAKFWDLITGECIATFIVSSERDGRYVRTFKIFDHESKLITGSGDGLIRIWSLINGQLLREKKVHSKTVSFIDVDISGKFILTCSYDKSLKIWNIANNKEKLIIEDNKDYSKAIFLDYNQEIYNYFNTNKIVNLFYNGLILVASNDLVLCDVNYNIIIKYKTDNYVSNFIVLYNDKIIITLESDEMGKITLWDLFLGIEISSISIGRYIYTISLTYVRSKNIIVVGESTGQLHFIKIEDNNFSNLKIIR